MPYVSYSWDIKWNDVSGFLQLLKDFRNNGIGNYTTTIIQGYDMKSHVLLVTSYSSHSSNHTLMDKGT